VYRQPFYLVGVESYSEYGHVPLAYGLIVDGKPVHHAFVTEWRELEHRYDVNPVRFDHYHPDLAGLFTPAECVGKLPETPFFDMLRHRYELDPARFTHYHHVLGHLVARDLMTECPSVMPPPVMPPGGGGGGVPEPGSFLLLAIGLVFIVVIGWLSRRRYAA
jgi:hypothetical protein